MTRAHGAYTNIVEDTFCRHEDAIVGLITKHNVTRVFFTGHSLGGGVANVAHLVVRGQLALGLAGLLGSGSPWTKFKPKLAEIDWLACTFAAPATIVRPADRVPTRGDGDTQLIKDLDDSSYNIVYGCDAVPRCPGMLTYLGDLLKNVVLPGIGLKTEDEVLNTLPLFGILLNTIGENKINDDDVPTRDDNVTKTLKNSGLTTVMRQFTHTGTVVYKKGPFSSCQYLKGNDMVNSEGEQMTTTRSANPGRREMCSDPTAPEERPEGRHRRTRAHHGCAHKGPGSRVWEC